MANKNSQHATSPPSLKEFERLMAKSGFQLTAEQRDRLWAFHQRLREADRKLNLTRIHNFEAMLEKHYVDSLLPATLVDLASPLMDLGSGGGFPGIPLAIRYPQLRLILVEGRRRRAGFLMHTARELGLENIEVVARKLNPHDEIPVRGVITRAFADAVDTLQRITASLPIDGHAYLMKGPNCDAEIAAVTESGLPFERVDDIHYLLPLSQAQRRLLVYRRIAVEPEAVPDPPAAVAHTPEDASVDESAAISSQTNRRYKHWQKLTSARGVKKYDETLLAGDTLAREFLRDHPQEAHGILLPVDAPAFESDSKLPIFRLSRKLFRTLDQANTGGPIVWTRIPQISLWPDRNPPTGAHLILPLQNPENVGAAIRNADAFGIAGVVLTQEAAHPFHPRALRASGPSAFRLPLYWGPALTKITELGMPLWALDMQGKPIERADLPETMGLIVGMEGPGTQPVPGNVERLRIDMPGDAESLNAAVATGVALYALKQKGLIGGSE